MSSVPRWDPSGACGATGVSSGAQTTQRGCDGLRFASLIRPRYPGGGRCGHRALSGLAEVPGIARRVSQTQTQPSVCRRNFCTPRGSLSREILERCCHPNRTTSGCPEITVTANPGSTFNIARYLFHSINFTSYRGT